MDNIKTGFIGLGQMGCGIARNLVEKRGPMLVFDHKESAMQSLVAAGASASASIEELASRCELIFLCLPFTPEVREVIFDANGIKASARPGLTIVDITTLSRVDAVDIGKELGEAGIHYWDCPVSGLPARADNGSLTVMFGGEISAFDAIKPYLDAFGSFVVHAGPLGSGQALKAVNNVIYNINIAAISEILPLALRAGLDAEVLASVVTSGSARSFAAEYFIPKMMDRVFDGDYSLQKAHKDIVNLQQLAVELGANLPLFEAMSASYQAAIDAGFGDEAKSAMLKVNEKAMGVQFVGGQAK